MFESELLFWLSVGLLSYTYIGYPALIWIWARLRPRRHQCAATEPEITILVVAYNEAPIIEARLENLLALDYPRDRMEVIVASDGSTDDTVERAKGFSDRGVRVVDFQRRRGKPAALNALVPGVRGEIVVLADARQRFDGNAVRTLVRHFADPVVGAVSGELVLVSGGDGGGIGSGVGFYWEYEKFIRKQESEVDSTTGTTGAIYAIRRDLFEPIPEDILLDDVLIPARIMRRGLRVLFEPAAVAYDRASATSAVEFRRKVRTIAGTFQLFLHEPWMLNPLQNRIWSQTVSHKGFRLLSPLGLAGAFATNVALLDQRFFVGTLIAQSAFYAAAAIGMIARDSARSHFLFNVPYAFCLLNWAAAVAAVRVVSGRQRVTWDKG